MNVESKKLPWIENTKIQFSKWAIRFINSLALVYLILCPEHVHSHFSNWYICFFFFQETVNKTYANCWTFRYLFCVLCFAEVVISKETVCVCVRARVFLLTQSKRLKRMFTHTGDNVLVVRSLWHTFTSFYRFNTVDKTSAPIKTYRINIHNKDLIM